MPVQPAQPFPEDVAMVTENPEKSGGMIYKRRRKGKTDFITVAVAVIRL